MKTLQEPSRPRAKSGTALSVRRMVERGGARFWRHSDFAGLPPSAVAAALSRQYRAGELQRVGKGVYYRSQPTSFGPSMPASSGITAATTRAPIHPSGLTAANVLGLSTQNPGRAEYATTAAARPRALQDAIVHTGRSPQRAHLSAEEGAILETLRDRADSSDLSPEETAARLLQLASADGRFHRLARAGLSEPPRVRAMLGALGQELGEPSKELDRLRNSLNPLSRFDFGRLSALRHAREWQAK